LTHGVGRGSLGRGPLEKKTSPMRGGEQAVKRVKNFLREEEKKQVKK